MNGIVGDFKQLEQEGLVTLNRFSPRKHEYVFKDGSRIRFTLFEVVTEAGTCDFEKIEVRDHPTRYRFIINLSNPTNVTHSDFWNEWSPESKVHWLRAKEMLITHLSDKIGIIKMD
jgi:hypothetical protein